MVEILAYLLLAGGGGLLGLGMAHLTFCAATEAAGQPTSDRRDTMTDPTSGSAPAPAPITVKASAAPIVSSEAFKAIVVAGCAFAADHLLRTEAAVAAAIPAGLAVATVAWGLLHRLHSWNALKYLANSAPNDVAVIGKKPWWVFW
jgi:hypothetical protein